MLVQTERGTVQVDDVGGMLLVRPSAYPELASEQDSSERGRIVKEISKIGYQLGAATLELDFNQSGKSGACQFESS